MPMALAENGGQSASNSVSNGNESSPPPRGAENEKGQAGQDDLSDEVDNFNKWCEEDLPIGIPDFIRPEMQHSHNSSREKESRRNGDGPGSVEGFRYGHHRSRMFVNQKFSSNNKQSRTGKSTEDGAIGGSSSSWDTPMKADSSKVYIADKEFLMSLRPNRTTQNTDVTECSHIVIHTSCHCSPDCTFGVCTNCFLVFCESSCLKAGLSTSGKVASSSETHLGSHSQFGRSVKAMAPASSQSILSDAKLTNPNTKGKHFPANPIPPVAKHPGFDPGASNGPPVQSTAQSIRNQESESNLQKAKSRPPIFMTPAKPNTQLAMSENKPLKSTATIPPDSGRNLNGGMECNQKDGHKNPFISESNSKGQEPLRPRMKKSPLSSSASKKAPQEASSGIFTQKSGYQESFKELPKRSFTTKTLDQFEMELGGKGHFEDAGNTDASSTNAPYSSIRDTWKEYDYFDHNEFVGSPRGRGGNRTSVRPFLNLEPVPPGKVIIDNPSYRNRIISHSSNSNQDERISRYPRGRGSSDGFKGNASLMGKVLRDPMNSADLNPAPPVFRGKARTSRTGVEDTGYTARVDSNVQVRLTKPLRGVNDRRTESKIESGTEGSNLGNVNNNGEVKEMELALKKLLQIGESDSNLIDCENRNPNLAKAEGSVRAKELKNYEDHPKTLETFSKAKNNEKKGLKIEIVPEGEVISDNEEEMIYRNAALPIDNEIEVPLGVTTMMKATCVEDLTCIYFIWSQAPRFYDPKKLNDPTASFRKKNSAREGDYCVVYHEGDILNREGFQRGQIMSVKRGICDVQLVDLGPLITIPDTKLFQLPKEYCQQRRLVCRFGLKQVQATGQSDGDYKAKSWMEKTFGLEGFVRVCVVNVNAVGNETSLTKHWGHVFTKEGSIAQLLIRDKIALEKIPKDVFKNEKMYKLVNFTNQASTSRALIRGEMFKCRILQGAKSLWNFFVIKETDEELYIRIEQLISRTLTLGLTAYNPWISGTGNLCLVERKKDEKWYRGRVLRLDQFGIASVTMIDTGESQNTAMEDLKEMPQPLKEIFPLAYLCKLPVKPVDSDKSDDNDTDPIWSDDLMRRLYKLNELSDDKGIIAWVLDAVGLLAVIDFKLPSDMTTWCTALEAIHEVEFHADQEMLLQIRRESSGNKNLKFAEMSQEIEPHSTNWLNNQRIREESLNVCNKEVDGLNNEVEGLNIVETAVTDVSLKAEENKPEDLPEFHYEQLEKLEELNDMEGKSFVFNRLIGFNIFTLIEKDSALTKLTELEKAIEEWIKSGDADPQTNEIAKIHHVVLAPFSKGRYCRAKIEEIKTVSDVPIAFLKFIEHGTVVRFPVTQLKKPNDKIMKIPEIVYFVQLDEVADDVPILVSDFQNLRASLDRTAVMFGEVKKQARGFRKVVLLTRKIEGVEPPRRLSTAVNELAVWEWEKLFRAMHRTFPEMSQKYDWSLWDLRKFMLDCPITNVLKRTSFELKIQHTSVIGKTMYLSGVPDDKNLFYQSRTVQTQMNMFMEKVKCADITGHQVTEYEHIVGVQLSEEKLNQLEKEKFRSNCNWHRCYFNSSEELLICIDCCWKVKPAKGVFTGLTIRPLSPDFYKACPLGITCKIDLSFLKSDRPEGIAKSLVPNGMVIQVVLTSRIPVIERELTIYDAQIPAMKRTFMKNFAQADLPLPLEEKEKA